MNPEQNPVAPTPAPTPEPVPTPPPAPQPAPAAPAPVPEPVAPVVPAPAEPIVPNPAPVEPVIPTPQPVPEPAPQPTPAAQPAPVSFTSAPEAPTAPTTAPAASEETEEDPNAPIKAAGPVPGSIGSAYAYSHAAPGNIELTNKKESLDLKDPKTRKLLLIIGAVFAAIIIVVVTVFIIINSNNGSTTKPTPSNPSTPSASDSLTYLACTRALSEDERNSYGITSSVNTTLTMNYRNDEFETAVLKTVAEFYSEDAAKTGADGMGSRYLSNVASLGYSSDPFESHYDVSAVTATETHTVGAEAVLSEAYNDAIWRIFRIGISRSTNKVLTDTENVTKEYTGLGYTCDTGSRDE